LSTHSRLALRGAALALLLALPAGVAVWYYFGRAETLSFVYGVGVGILGFASIALTVSLLTVRPSGVRILLGVASYGGRLAFALVAVGVPVYLGTWPVLPMLCGLVGVYVVENVSLLKMAPRSIPVRAPEPSVHGGAERRTEI
jgi:hypothetical protein